MLRHQAAERYANHVRPRHALTPQQGGKLIRELFDAVTTGWDRRGAMARKIIRQQAEVTLESGSRDVPEMPVDAETMQQHNDGACAATMQLDRVGIERA